MVLESDISSLMDKWESNLSNQSPDYKIAVRDCIYDLKCMIDRQMEEEADDAFEQQLKEGDWDGFFRGLMQDGMFFA